MALPRLLPKLAAVTAVAGRTRQAIGGILIAVLIALLTTATPAAAESVPLTSLGGVYMLPVRINDAVTIPFIIDSGAAEVAITADVFLVLSRTGTVSQTDFLGTSTYTMANGTTQLSNRFRLRKLMVGNHVVTDVVASVIPVNGEPLLGQSFLSRLPAWSVDNARHTLVLNDAGQRPSQPYNAAPSQPYSTGQAQLLPPTQALPQPPLRAGWWLVMGSFSVMANASQAAADVTARCGLRSFHDLSDKFTGFTPGYNVVVAGPYGTRDEGERILQTARACVPADSYVKYGELP
jgi:clan AA aspartic protease (TIGR02281 family)